MKNITKKGKATGFKIKEEASSYLVVHTCDTSKLPHCNITTIDQNTTRYDCPLCRETVTIGHGD